MLDLLLSSAFRLRSLLITCSVLCRNANHDTTLVCLLAIDSRIIVMAIGSFVAKGQSWPINELLNVITGFRDLESRGRRRREAD